MRRVNPGELFKSRPRPTVVEVVERIEALGADLLKGFCGRGRV